MNDFFFIRLVLGLKRRAKGDVSLRGCHVYCKNKICPIMQNIWARITLSEYELHFMYLETKVELLNIQLSKLNPRYTWRKRQHCAPAPRHLFIHGLYMKSSITSIIISCARQEGSYMDVSQISCLQRTELLHVHGRGLSCQDIVVYFACLRAII